MHRTAAAMDGWFRVTAGVVSSDPARARDAGVAVGLDPARSYGDVAEMLARRTRASRRHRRGRHHDAERHPLSPTPPPRSTPGSTSSATSRSPTISTQACDLVARTAQQGRIFAIAHGVFRLSDDPLRPARSCATARSGRSALVQVEYIQSGLATRLEDGPQNNRLRWMLDPAAERARAGDERDRLPCAASRDASCRACRVARVAADVGALMPGRKVVDYASALVEFEGGARGTFTVTQAAAGGENDIRLARLRREGHARLVAPRAELSHARAAGRAGAQSSAAATPSCRPRSSPLGRTPRGHPEGLREAFANIYAEVAQERMARALGDPCRSSRIRASRTARTRWRSSKRAWRRSPREPGSLSGRRPAT